MRSLIALALVTALSSCGGINIPWPKPTPTPEPKVCDPACSDIEACIDGECVIVEPEPCDECLPGVPWCHETDPRQSCSTAESPCKHNPSTSPCHCELAPECPPPPPDPDVFDLAACEAKYESGVCLDGSPGMRIGWYQGVRDPKDPERCIAGNCMADATPIVRNCNRCTAYGWTDGRCGCATLPEGWQPEEARYKAEVELMGGETFVCEVEGDLEIDRPGGWFCRVVKGKKGRIRACFPNGKACSKWIEVDR